MQVLDALSAATKEMACRWIDSAVHLFGSVTAQVLDALDHGSSSSRAALAIGETLIRLHPPLPLIHILIGMERGRLENDSLADGAGGPLILSGGRLCVEHTDDISICKRATVLSFGVC